MGAALLFASQLLAAAWQPWLLTPATATATTAEALAAAELARAVALAGLCLGGGALYFAAAFAFGAADPRALLAGLRRPLDRRRRRRDNPSPQP